MQSTLTHLTQFGHFKCYVTVLNRFKSCFSFGAILLSIMDFIVIFLTKDAYSLKLHDIGNDTIE